MIGPPSGQASSLREGNTIAPRRGGFAGSKGRLRAQLGLWQRVAVAIVAIVASVGITGLGRASAYLLLPSIELASPGGADATRDVSAAVFSRNGRDHGARPILKAVTSDVDEEDPQWAVPDDTAIAIDYVPYPHAPGRAFRGEPSLDPSRFAAGTGLPRGPPLT